MPILLKIIGITGLLLITWGVTINSAQKRDWLFILGGIALLAYSIYIGDIIFIILQTVYILVTGYHRYTNISIFEKIYTKLRKL